MNIRKALSITAGAAAALPQAAMAQVTAPGYVPIIQSDLLSAIIGIVNFFLILVGLIAVVFLIIGGVRYVISQGDDDQISKAKNTILYAIIGLIVIGLSYAVVQFVISALGGAAA